MTIECMFLAITSAVFFVYQSAAIGMLCTKTPFKTYAPLIGCMACTTGIFICSIFGAVDQAKDFATFAYLAGSIYLITS